MQGSHLMGISKEILTVGASGCFLTPFLPVPQSSQTPEESPPTPLLRGLHLAAHPGYACGMAHTREGKKKRLGVDCDKTAPAFKNGCAGNSSTQVLLL